MIKLFCKFMTDRNLGLIVTMNIKDNKRLSDSLEERHPLGGRQCLSDSLKERRPLGGSQMCWHN